MLKQPYHSKTYFFIAIFVIAVLLRLYQIDQPFIDGTSWRQTDTATIADNFYHGHWNILLPQISWNGPGENYVGYEFQTITYLTALLYRIFGTHDWVARSLAVSFSLWGLFAFYQLVCRVWTDNHALLAALILAILPNAVYVGRSFLPDPIMLSCVVTAAWLLIVYLQTERSLYLLLATLAGTLGLLTKVSGVFCFPAIFYAVWLILSRKNKLYSRLSFLIIVAVFFTGTIVTAYYLWAIYISQNFPPYYIAANQYWVWKHGLSYFLENYYFLPKLYQQLQFFWTLPIITLVVFGCFCRFKNTESFVNQKIEQLPYFFHFWLLGCIFYYLIAAKGLVDNPTNLNLANPAVAALTANALIVIGTILKQWLKQPIAIAVLIITLIYITGVTQKQIQQVLFYPWAENEYQLGLNLQKVSQSNDLVIAMASTVGDTTIIYYSQRRGWTFPPAYMWSSFDDLAQVDAETSLQLLKELQAKGADWLGITASRLEQLAESNPLTLKYIQNNFELYQDQSNFKIYRISQS